MNENDFSSSNVGGNYGSNVNSPNTIVVGNAPGYSLWLTLGIIQIVVGCCCAWPGLITGIIAIVLASQGNKLFKSGDYEAGNAKIKQAKIANLIGWGIEVFIIICVVLLAVFSTLAELA